MSLLLYVGAAWGGLGALLVAYGVGRHHGVADAKADLRADREQRDPTNVVAADGGERG